MGIILLVLLLALILGGLGFAIHILWWIALVVLVIWLVGFLVRMGEGTSRGRWYRWETGSWGRRRPLRGGGTPINPDQPGSGWTAARASSTAAYIGSRSARPVI